MKNDTQIVYMPVPNTENEHFLNTYAASLLLTI